jgi:hypothetical protein
MNTHARTKYHKANLPYKTMKIRPYQTEASLNAGGPAHGAVLLSLPHTHTHTHRLCETHNRGEAGTDKSSKTRNDDSDII